MTGPVPGPTSNIVLGLVSEGFKLAERQLVMASAKKLELGNIAPISEKDLQTSRQNEKYESAIAFT